MQDKEKSPEDKYGLKAIVDAGKALWATPLGKAMICVALGGIGVVAMGGSFRVLTFTMHGFKDFRDAWRR